MSEIIFNKQNNDTIHIDDIDIEEHIIVAKDTRNDDISILTRIGFDRGKFYFLCLNDSPAMGNRYTSNHNYKNLIISMFDEHEVQAFTDYKEAFKWLLNE